MWFSPNCFLEEPVNLLLFFCKKRKIPVFLWFILYNTLLVKYFLENKNKRKRNSGYNMGAPFFFEALPRVPNLARFNIAFGARCVYF